MQPSCTPLNVTSAKRRKKKKFAKCIWQSHLLWFGSIQRLRRGACQCGHTVTNMRNFEDLRIITLCSDRFPPRPVCLWHSTGLATVKLPRPLHFTDLWNQNDPATKVEITTSQLRNSSINLGYCGRLEQKKRRKKKVRASRWQYICYVISSLMKMTGRNR